jgi:hypothetical protein
MTPLKKGLSLAAIAVILNSMIGLTILRPLLDLSWGATAGWTVALVLFGGLFGLITGLKDVYAFEWRPVWAFILDVTWSSLNTVTGLVWMIYCAAKGTFQTPDETTQKRGIIIFSGAALPGADASTLGTVMGGTWLLHEAVHVQQARIFGPFYWPAYLLSYFTAMLSRFITGRFGNPHWEAYDRVVMEDWAYRAAPDGATSIDVATAVLWFFLALVNVLAVAVLLAPVPVIGALPQLIGLDAIPWWIGLIVIMLYALLRSFFTKGSTGGWQLIYN